MLHINGNQIVNASGCTVRLHGVNVSGLEYSPTGDGGTGRPTTTISGVTMTDYVTIITEAVQVWHANCIRLPINQDYWFGCTANGQTPNQTAYRAMIQAVINYCSNNNVYLDLDLHWSSQASAASAPCGAGWGGSASQQPMPDANAVTLWQSISGVYGNNPAVLFDLYNEPYPTTWAILKNGGTVAGTSGNFTSPGLQAIVNAVRTAGANNICLIGGLGYSYDLSPLATAGNALTQASGNGILYTSHIYNNKGVTAGGWDPYVTTITNNYPVFIEEFGASNSDPANWDTQTLAWINGSNNRSYTYSALAWCFSSDVGPTLLTSFSGYPTTSYHGAPVSTWLYNLNQTPTPNCGASTPTFTFTPTSTATRTNTPTNTYTFTGTPTRTATSTATSTRTNSPTATLTATPSVTPTRTFTATSTPTSTATRTASMTPTASLTATPSVTPTRTFTGTSTATSTPTATATRTNTFTGTPTNTLANTATPTSTPTRTLTFTLTPTSTPTRTFTATSSPTGTSSPTSVPTPPLVHLTVGPSEPPAANFIPGSSVPVLQLQVNNQSNAPTTFTSLKLTASGTGNDATGITSVSLYVDTNGNGILDGGDSLLTSGTYGSDNGTLTLSFTNSVPAFTTEQLLVVYTFSATASGTYTASVAANSDMTGVDGTYGLPVLFTGAPVTGNAMTEVNPTATFTATATSTGTPTRTFTLTDSPTASFTFTATATSTPTKTSTPTDSPTGTLSPTHTLSATPTSSATRTFTPTGTPTFTFTATATFTWSHTPTRTFTPTFTFSATSTSTLTPVATATSSPTRTFTATASFTATFTHSFTPTATASPSATPTSTWTATSTPTSTPLPLFKPVLYPNPVTGGDVTLNPGLSATSDVTVSILTTAFRRVNLESFPKVPAGATVTVVLTDRMGVPLANGLYYVAVQTAQGRSILKLLILR